MPDETIASAAVELIVLLSQKYEPKHHEFSLAFERKMARLIRKVNNSVRYRFIRRVACIILVLSSVIMTLLMTSPTVSAAIIGWIREQYDTYIEYLLPDSVKNNPASHQYAITLLPDGYHETKRFDVENLCTVLYADQTNNRIHFIYSKDPEAISFLVLSDESTVINTFVSGHAADLYIPINPDDSTSIVWSDEDIIFFISYVAEPDVIVKLAESVK